MASRRMGGSVLWSNDELFAERENLIKPGEAMYQPHTFGHKGQIYDGWETRRRREPGHDQVIIRLGLPGIIRGVIVDTSWFTGNFPPFASVDACAVDDHPNPEEITGWETIVPKSPLRGNTLNEFDVSELRRYTHVRLTIYPDGGVARLRVHGFPFPDATFLDLNSFDLAALEHGARVVGCSNMFYSSPTNLISPGFATSMGDGWETERRRGDGNDYVTVQLTARGVIRLAELDTSHFKGNAPGWAALSGCDTRVAEPDEEGAWFELLPKVRLQPDTRHRFVLPDANPTTHVRLDIYPDGGMARLRLHGALTDDGREHFIRRWLDLR
ncbi:MAG TPA: allantoicase [Actinophytocola sp.]|uniref:allantoicase n=1 Tax=Actinophytocola sp. TaxID=1872138 RepID=UPI002DFDD246|nr:allantoicase [Actinophytocola sp.]